MKSINIENKPTVGKAVPKVLETEPRGLVFSIQAHSVHDGPGARTTVFMSSCPLSCVWCCNPEGLFSHPVMLHSDVKCVRCGACISACPKGAVSVVDGKMTFDRKLCNVCETHECVDACLHEANSTSGKYYTIPELMRVFERDRMFWGSKGGVTFSGGEPLMQKSFMLPLLKKCKDSYIHVTIETTSCLAPEYFMEAVRYVDWIFTDIKHMDSEKHKELTGVGNRLILENIGRLSQADWWNGIVVPRIPIIPGVNDSDENIEESARFVKDAGLEVINILPFHRLGESKYRQLGRTYRFQEMKAPEPAHMKHLQDLIQKQGLYCFIGYETPF